MRYAAAVCREADADGYCFDDGLNRCAAGFLLHAGRSGTILT